LQGSCHADAARSGRAPPTTRFRDYPPISEATIPPPPLQVLLVDDGSPQIPMVREELARLGHRVVGVIDAAVELAEHVARLNPDVVLIGTDSQNRDTLEHLAAMNRAAPRPVVLFTGAADRAHIERAMRAGVSSYVVDGIAPERLRPLLDVAIARFGQEGALRRELAQARQQLSDRKRIERAKGILMASRGLDEESAYRELRRMAMDRGSALADIAQRIIDAKALLS
jgi:response regulator NasT